MRSSYTGRSDFERGDDASGDSWYKHAELHHRIPLDLFDWPNIECGQWYLRVGADYRRWDFGNDGGLPIPNTLQSGAAVIGLEYVVRNQTTMLIEARPGFFFEHEVDSGNFNVPVTAYRAHLLQAGGRTLLGAARGLLLLGFPQHAVHSGRGSRGEVRELDAAGSAAAAEADVHGERTADSLAGRRKRRAVLSARTARNLRESRA